MKFNNGNVKELYDNGLVKFEGKYLNDKKWNGIGYTYNGIKLYEIKNGCGYIKEYSSDGTLLFEGNYLNGERNGKGKEYSNDKLIFEGNYIDGVRNGKGKKYHDNLRIKFEGEYLDGKRRNGILYDYNGDKILEIKEGIPINFFKHYFSLREAYYDFKKYATYFRRKFLLIEKEKAKEYNYGELVFKGEYLFGKRNGKGSEYFFKELIFEGEYIDGKRNGLGKEYYINKKIKFEGEYKDGKKNGKGKEYDYFGRLIFEGEYVNNKRMNGIIYKYNNNDFSKYIYLIPSKYFKQCENKVPIDVLKKYYDEYHIKSSGVKRLRSKLRLQKPKNEKIKDDKRKNKWEKNKKLKYSINNWQRKSSFKCIISNKKQY